MEILHTEIPGLVTIRPKVFGDSRGYFLESYSEREFSSLVAPVRFVQDNQSFSSFGVVRGMHLQKAPFQQAKLVRCVLGSVLDIALDLRPSSPTFLKSVAVELSGENHRQFFIPKGFAHGFVVLSPTAIFQYKCDEFYHPEAEIGINALDPALGIDWGIAADAVKQSSKDMALPNLEQFLKTASL